MVKIKTILTALSNGKSCTANTKVPFKHYGGSTVSEGVLLVIEITTLDPPNELQFIEDM